MTKVKTRQVAVTGMGVVSALGDSLKFFHAALRKGQHGLTEFQGRLVGRINTLNVVPDCQRLENMVVIAARDAIKNAGVQVEEMGKKRSAVYFAGEHHQFSSNDFIKFPKSVDSIYKTWSRFEQPVDRITSELNFTLPPNIFLSACAAGLHAIEAASESIRSGDLDIALVGGGNSCMHAAGIAAYSAINALGDNNSVSFDENRCGFIMGEGAAFIVLEKVENAKKRKAPIIAILSGFGRSLDAESIYDPHPAALGAKKAIYDALKQAGLSANEIDVINAHATGTIANDKMEISLFKEIFSHNEEPVYLQAVKPYTGHLLAASGCIESIASILSVQYQEIYSIPRLKKKDADLQNLTIPSKCESKNIRHLLKTSYGFGGQNAALVISRYLK